MEKDELMNRFHKLENIQIKKEECEAEIEKLHDLKRISDEKENQLVEKVKRLEKQLNYTEEASKNKIKNAIKEAKDSASKAIAQAQIYMDEFAKGQGADLWADDIQGWRDKVAEILKKKASKTAQPTNSQTTTSSKNTEPSASKKVKTRGLEVKAEAAEKILEDMAEARKKSSEDKGKKVVEDKGEAAKNVVKEDTAAKDEVVKDDVVPMGDEGKNEKPEQIF